MYIYDACVYIYTHTHILYINTHIVYIGPACRCSAPAARGFPQRVQVRVALCGSLCRRVGLVIHVVLLVKRAGAACCFVSLKVTERTI